MALCYCAEREVTTAVSRTRNDPNAARTVVQPPQPEDALGASVRGATDGLVYRVHMIMGAGRPYSEVVMTVAFPGPFMLITHNPKARACLIAMSKAPVLL